MKQTNPPSIMIIGGNPAFIYLIQRYAGRAGYQVSTVTASESVEGICRSQPDAVIFPSLEILEGSQPLITTLTNCDIPIIVCSSPVDQNRTRELGADYCLFHPLRFDNFSIILRAITMSQHADSAESGKSQ